MNADNLVGRQLGDFVIRERIGQGGMAVVYRAFQPSVQRDVALKVIHLGDERWHDEGFRRRFTKEAETIAGLEHIHILPVYDYGVTEDTAYLVMRLLRGGTLRDLLEAGPLSIDQTADLFRQIAKGLAYAHSKGVIHRDLKPSNIMLDDAGNAFLTDFGLAKLVGDPLQITKSGNIVGTPTYMSPEQLRGDVVDHRSDLYSLGVLLYHMLVGRAPFGGSSSDLVATIYQHLEKPPIPPRDINRSLPEPLEAMVLRALRKKPDERYQSADEMADDIYLAIGRKLSSSSGQIAVVRHEEAVPGVSARAIPYRAVLAMSAVLLAVVAVVLGLILTRGSDEPEPTPTPEKATVLAGKHEAADRLAISDDEIERARAALGPGGFVAYITCTQNTEFHATQTREIADFLSQYGLPHHIYDSNADDYQQVTQIEKARADGATGLIICPLNPELLDRPLTSIQQAGLPLVFMHSDIPSYGGVLLSGDDYLMGLAAGNYAGQLIRDEMAGQADVIILDFPEMPIIVTRANGLEDGLLELAPEANIIGRYKGGTREIGKASVSKLIADGVTFDVIVSINDAGAFGAIEAMEEDGIKPESVIISSVDAEALALDYIQRDYFMRGSVDVSSESFARTAVYVMIKLLARSTVAETYVVPPGGVVTREILNERPADGDDSG